MEYNKTITYLKSFAITCMVIGHCGCSIPGVHRNIYLFHMPLFFFLSGYCFNLSQNSMGLFKKRLKRLYWPYVKWGIVFLFLHNIFFYLHLYSSKYGYNGCVSYLYNTTHFILFSKQILMFRHTEELLGGYWFLSALFGGTIISWILLHIFKKEEFAAITALIVSCFFNIYGKYPFQFTLEFAVSFIFIMGFLFSKRGIKTINWKLSIIILLSIFSLSHIYMSHIFFSPIVNNKVFMEIAVFGYESYCCLDIIMYLFISIILIWSFYSLFSEFDIKAKRINNLVEYIGNNTLTILTFHFISFKLISLLIIIQNNLPIDMLSQFPVIADFAYDGWWIAYAIIGIAIPLLCTRLIAYLKTIYRRDCR